MARRILVRGEDRTVELVELAADNEVELQDVLRQAPNLIPIDDLGLDGPMTALPSGQVDLLGVTPAGDILIIDRLSVVDRCDHAASRSDERASEAWELLGWLGTQHRDQRERRAAATLVHGHEVDRVRRGEELCPVAGHPIGGAVLH
jgi:hypothetical protein